MDLDLDPDFAAARRPRRSKRKKKERQESHDKMQQANKFARMVSSPVLSWVCRLVTLCSGMEAVVQGYEHMHIPLEHEVACDSDKNCRRVIEHNFNPRVCFDDVATIDVDQVPEHDMLWAGAPCQPFSSAGLGEGLTDKSGRGIVMLHILRIIKAKVPKVVILENVSNIRSSKHRATFESVLEILREIRMRRPGGPDAFYHVEWNVMNTCNYGLPQSRQRVYIVCVRSDVLQRPLQWPAPSPSQLDIDSLLGERPSQMIVSKALPPQKSTTTRANVLAGLEFLRQCGAKPFEETWIMNIDDSPNRMSKPLKGCSPCLTRARAARGGHWVTTHGCRMGTETMLKLQGMDPDRIKRPSDVKLGLFNAMIGNAMSVNVVEVLLAMLSRSCPQVLNAKKPLPLPCQWATFD